MSKKNSYTQEDLVVCGYGKMFGENNAQLPLKPMLMFDRIVSITEAGGKANKGEIVAELDIIPGLWFFDCHFDGDPVMPGCLGLDAMWQLLGFYLLWSGLPGIGRALGADNIKFFGQVLPKAKKVVYKLDIKRIINRGAIVGLADGEMFVDGKKIYSAERLKVGLFKDPSNF